MSVPIFQNASRSHASNSGTGSFALPGSSHVSFFFGDMKKEDVLLFFVVFLGALGSLRVAAGELTDAASEAGAALVSAVCFLSLFFFSCRCVVSDVLVFFGIFLRVVAFRPISRSQLFARRARVRRMGPSVKMQSTRNCGRDSAHRDLSFARRSRHSAMAKRTRLLRVNTTMLAGLGAACAMRFKSTKGAFLAFSWNPSTCTRKQGRRTLVM